MNRFLPCRPCAMPAQDLARDDARVAAGAHQRPEARRVGDAVGVGVGPGLVGLLERRPDRGQHVRAGVAVGHREHVERVDLVDVGLEGRDGAPEGGQEAGPVARAARHQATSVPLAARSDGRGSPEAGCTAGGGDAVLAPEPADPDRDPVGLAAERVEQRVAHRALDLARDLGDREAVRDGQLEVDRERVADLEVEARVREAEPLEEPPDRATAGEPGHAVHRHGRRAHEVADGASRDEGPAGDGISGHARDVLRAGAGRLRRAAAGPGGAAVSAVLRYHPARAGPRPTRAWNTLIRGTHRPWLAPAPSAARHRWAASTPSPRG